MKSFLISATNGEYWVQETDGSFDDARKLIGCEWIDLVHLKVDGKQYVALVDDEGLLVADPIITMISVGKYTRFKRCICGTVVILKEDEDGEFVGLTDTDIATLEVNCQVNSRTHYNDIDRYVLLADLD